jgi:uncharacterized membrane protein (DUF373 family)
MDTIEGRMRTIFERIVGVVFSIILAFIVLGIAIGTVQLFVTTWKLFAFEGITGHYIDLIADVLTLYVLIELSRSLVEYFNTHRLRLTFIADAAIVFVIREVLIMLFKHDLKPEMLYPLSLFLFVLGALRISSVLVYQRERRISMSTGAQ